MKESMTRCEFLVFNLKLNKTAYDKVIDALKVLGKTVPMNENDSLNLEYQCYIDYFGQVEKNLRAISTILDTPGVIIDVDSNALIKGQILIYDVLKQLEEIKVKIENPNLLTRIKRSLWN